jgi:hypothetical protein
MVDSIAHVRASKFGAWLMTSVVGVASVAVLILRDRTDAPLLPSLLIIAGAVSATIARFFDSGPQRRVAGIIGLALVCLGIVAMIVITARLRPAVT